MGIGASQFQICPALHPAFLEQWGSKTQGIADVPSFRPAFVSANPRPTLHSLIKTSWRGIWEPGQGA